jgi:hypothetical protein
MKTKVKQKLELIHLLESIRKATFKNYLGILIVKFLPNCPSAKNVLLNWLLKNPSPAFKT